MSYRLDIKDTLKRIASVGNLIDLNEDSNYAKIANALLSMERARLDEAVESTKKTLGDWAGKELDNWWGLILSIERLPGVESAEDYVGDATYISRIKRFMEAGSKGISLEAVRMAAEAGGGVPFRVNKSENRIILTPLENLDAATRAGALKAVYRIAPARSIVEIGNAESYTPRNFTNIWSDSSYVGEDPSKVRLSGPQWDSENMMVVASADKWSPAPEGSLSPGTGLPNMLMRGGSWHVGNVGFGEQASLTLGTSLEEIVNRVKMTVGEGKWKIEVFNEESLIYSENFTSHRWADFDRTFGFNKSSGLRIVFTNIDQEPQDLFIKGTYIGARVDDDNKINWLALGGKEGSNARNEVIISSSDQILKGMEWIAKPAPDPSFQREFYGTVGGSPRKISALGFKTRTPGAIFKISYSNDNLDTKIENPTIYNYDELEWIDLPKYYKLKNGRVDIETVIAKHIKLSFTNLRPMLLKEYQTES